MNGNGARAVTVVVGLLLLCGAGCSAPTTSSSPSRPSAPAPTVPPSTVPSMDGTDPAPASGWQRLDLDGDVSALGGDYTVIAAGSDTAGAWVRFLTGEDPGVLRRFVSGLTSPDTVTVNAGFVAVTDLEDGRSARAAGALTLPGIDDVDELDTPTDGQGQAPTWLTMEFDGEEALHAVGTIDSDPIDSDQAKGLQRLVAWDDTGRWRPLPSVPQVYTDPTTVVSADATESGMVVAGGLTTDAAAAGTAIPITVWAGPALLAPRQRWQRLPLRPGLDAVTDVECWDLGCWVAGTRDGRAQVHDLDRLDGRPVPTPSLDVAPDATVLVARTPVTSALVLAVETRRGNEVWVRDRRDTRRTSGWRRYDAPDGDLTAARVSDGVVHLLVDARVWRGRLTGLPEAEPR